MDKTKYLFSYWKKIKELLRGKLICLALDFDGTLVPIARTPDKAVMPKKTKDLLRRLSKKTNCRIAIISGRTLKDILKRVGLRNIIYVGNHGFEIKGPKITFKSPISVRYRKILEEIKNRLNDSLSSVEGVLIEDKEFSLSLHYRLVDKKSVSKVKTEFYAALLSHQLKNDVRVKPGKMVLEVVPPVAWNKGKVVLWLLEQRIFTMPNKKKKVFPVYIGDDVTDEDAFESLKNKGLTIFVGKPYNTKARFYLNDTKEVTMFLTKVLKNLDIGAT